MIHLFAAIAFTTNPSNLLVISGAVGFLLPHAIALVNQATWRPAVKATVAFVACLVAAGVTTWAKGDLNFSNWAASAGVIFALARVSYAGLWRPTNIAPSIESATTFGDPGP